MIAGPRDARTAPTEPSAIASLGGARRSLLGCRPLKESLARLRPLASPGSHGAWTLRAGLALPISERSACVRTSSSACTRSPRGSRRATAFIEPADLDLALLEGVVRARGLHDELTGELFAAVETHAGEVLYVRLTAEAAEFIGDGDIVRVGRTAEAWIKPTDRVLVGDRRAERRPLRPGGASPPARGRPATGTPARDLVAGNLRRLERLERYGLVTRLPEGTWQVPLDLLAQLQAREVSHPRHALLVQYLGAPLRVQTGYAGPTWLDKQLGAAEGPGTPVGLRPGAGRRHAESERSICCLSASTPVRRTTRRSWRPRSGCCSGGAERPSSKPPSMKVPGQYGGSS